jgi:hypothetical protein
MSRIIRTLGAVGFLAASVPAISPAAQFNGPHHLPDVVFSQTLVIKNARLQIDFAQGVLELPRSEVVQRIQVAASAVTTYYGLFPVPRARILILPVTGRHGVLNGTTWGDTAGFPAFVRLRIGQSTSHNELAADWIITHELVHTALPSLPDDQHWLEEGIASYVEPIARVQAGQLSAAKIWEDMVTGMPNGEPGPGDRGLDVTRTWGRTYWGGALFCLVADVEIRKQTNNRHGLQDALRAVVDAGGSIDQNWPLSRVLRTGDQATNTDVLEEMYSVWSKAPIPVDLAQLWSQLGIRVGQDGVTFDSSAPLAAIRTSITTAAPTNAAAPTVFSN